MESDRSGNRPVDNDPASAPSTRKKTPTSVAVLVLVIGIVVGLFVVWPLMRSAFEKGRATTNPAAAEAPR